MPSISPKDIPPYISNIIEKLSGGGYSTQVVGGAVRDLLLDKTPKDFDIITQARPEQIKAIFGRRSFLIGRRFRLALVRSNHQNIEVATYRSQSTEESDILQCEDSGLLLRDNVYGTIDTDALRRDFTVNALYYDVVKDEIIDKVGGLADIENRLIRMIGDNIEQRLREDPLRAVRALRIGVQNDLQVEKDLSQKLPEALDWLAGISQARMGLEISKIFISDRRVAILAALAEYDLLSPLVPDPVAQAFHPDQQGTGGWQLFRSIDADLRSPTPSTEEALLPSCPADLSNALLYSTLYLPFFLNHCSDLTKPENISSTIEQINRHLYAPTVRSERQGMLAIWRALPRLFRLKSRQMRNFSRLAIFTPTWLLYHRGVCAGVFATSPAYQQWQEYLQTQPVSERNAPKLQPSLPPRTRRRRSKSRSAQKSRQTAS